MRDKDNYELKKNQLIKTEAGHQVRVQIDQEILLNQTLHAYKHIISRSTGTLKNYIIKKFQRSVRRKRKEKKNTATLVPGHKLQWHQVKVQIVQGSQ
jgi:hypothetical protein